MVNGKSFTTNGKVDDVDSKMEQVFFQSYGTKKHVSTWSWIHCICSFLMMMELTTENFIHFMHLLDYCKPVANLLGRREGQVHSLRRSHYDKGTGFYKKH